MPARALWVVLVAAVWLLPATASAKDLCFKDSIGGQLWLAKWKTLKKRGQVNPVYGYYFVAGSTYPLHGSAVVRLDGWTVIGAVAHNILGTGSDITMSMLLNPATGVAIGKYDTNGNGLGDVSRTWNPDSCKDADGT